MLATNYTKFTGLDIWFGHGNGDPGAQSSGYQEQDMVRRLQTNLKKYGDKAGINIRFYVGNMYADNNVAWSKGRAVFELHLDSAGTAGQGGHIIIQEGIGGLDAIDKNIIEKLKENFGIVNRDGAGYDERNDLANPNRCAAAGINYRLVELFFINDATDRNYFLNNIDEVARDLISAYIGKEVGQATATPTPTPTPIAVPVPDVTFSGQAHIQKKGWVEMANNILGTVGESLRLEAFSLVVKNKGVVQPMDGVIHVQDIGDIGYQSGTNLFGTVGQEKRLEAVKINVGNGVQYRAHIENQGWSVWVRSGEWVGTTGKSLRIEALEFRVA